MGDVLPSVSSWKLTTLVKRRRAAAAGLPQMIGAVRSADGTSGALGPGQSSGAEGQDEAAVKVQAAFRGHQARLQTAGIRAEAGEQQ
jgi:hypothetical protein